MRDSGTLLTRVLYLEQVLKGLYSGFELLLQCSNFYVKYTALEHLYIYYWAVQKAYLFIYFRGSLQSIDKFLRRLQRRRWNI